MSYGVTDQQNEHVSVPTVIAHMMGGVRLGFEGLHGLMGCSQGYMNRVRSVCILYRGVRNALWR